MNYETLLIEGTKLALQFGGALVVARLAVRWALNRYKSEQAWGRQLTAYVDVVTALGTMQRIAGEWEDEFFQQQARDEEWQKERHARWQVALRQLESVSAVAALVLPTTTADLLDQIEVDLARARDNDNLDYFDAVQEQSKAVRTGLQSLVTEGRRVLGPHVTNPI